MDANRFATVLAELLRDKGNVLTSVGRDVFRDRVVITEAYFAMSRPRIVNVAN